MTDNYGALCSDFYINHRLSVKMDLPTNRETVLGMFDRVRRDFPEMNRFRRLKGELALETDPARDGPQQFVAFRSRSVRSGLINPVVGTGKNKDIYRLHRMCLEIAPYFLSISPLDVDFVELMFGFDLMAAGNHDAIVYDALVAGSPLGRLIDSREAIPLDCQPILGVSLSESMDLEAYFDIKTRTPRKGVASGEFEPEPLSIYVTLRKYGPLDDVSQLGDMFRELTTKGEDLLSNRVVPNLVIPIREAIGTSGTEQ
jgi:hypothetical protein